jgi:hypothetical protein
MVRTAAVDFSKERPDMAGVPVVCPHIRPVPVVPNPFTQRVRHPAPVGNRVPNLGCTAPGWLCLRERNHPNPIHGPTSSEVGPFSFWPHASKGYTNDFPALIF